MNKKGFTLVELLAVIIILALLAILASTSVTKIVNDSKDTLEEAQVKLLESAAKTWAAKNIYSLPRDGECIYLTLRDLKNHGLVDLDITNPKTGKKISNEIKIKISSKTSENNVDILNYEVDSKNINGCENYYNSICTLVSGNAREIGSEYECQVNDKKSYNFFVLSVNQDETYNLIMDSNINSTGEAIKENKSYGKSTVEWMSKSDYGCNKPNYYDPIYKKEVTCANSDKGPVTAMTYLHAATKDWVNVPNIVMEYVDENFDFDTLQTGTLGTGYGKIITTDKHTYIKTKDGKTTAKFKNLKARLPVFKEMHGEGKCLTTGEIQKKYLREYGGCPLWLVNYFKQDNNGFYKSSDGKKITQSDTYWILSSSGGIIHQRDPKRVWYVNMNGIITPGTFTTTQLGIRPVITVRLD